MQDSHPVQGQADTVFIQALYKEKAEKMSSLQNINRLIAKTSPIKVGDKVALKVLEGREQEMRGGEVLALDENGQATVLLAGDAQATVCQVWELTDYAEWSKAEAERFEAAAAISNTRSRLESAMNAYGVKIKEIKLINNRWHLIFPYDSVREYAPVNAMLWGIKNPVHNFASFGDHHGLFLNALSLYKQLGGTAEDRNDGLILSDEALEGFLRVAEGDMDISELFANPGDEISEALISETFVADLADTEDRLAAALGSKVTLYRSTPSCEKETEVYAQFSETAALKILDRMDADYLAKLPSECSGSKDKAALGLSRALIEAMGEGSIHMGNIQALNHRQYAAACYISLDSLRKLAAAVAS